MTKISIITVTFNAGKFLEKTILNILNQSDSHFEYLIIDGKSTDETVKIIQKYDNLIKSGKYPHCRADQFRWISEPDEGLYDAMNKGLALATGDFVWFVNAGDKIYDNNTLSQVMNTIEQHPQADVFYGQTIIIDEADNILGERHKIAPKHLKKNDFLNGSVICHQSLIVRKSLAPAYDLQYRISSDYDWTVKVVAQSKENVYISEYLSRFMVAGISLQQMKLSLRERFVIMRNHFGLLRTLFIHAWIILKFPFSRKKK
jgi:glycosyltransferase involved in cell wall biosynthesis